MSTPDWMEDLKPLPNNPYERILHRLLQYDKTESVKTTEQFRMLLTEVTQAEKQIIDNLDAFSVNNIIFDAFKNGVPLSVSAKYLNWKAFEELVATILSQSGWKVQSNFRYFGEGKPSDRSRYEIDIIASKKPHVLIIDCKRYKNPTQAPMKKATQDQKERLYTLYEQLPIIHDGLVSAFPRWNITAYLVPIILTWKNHQLSVHDRIAICSIDSFEDFIINFTTYSDEFDLFKIAWTPMFD